MRPEILGIFIPILFVIGLFVTISLNIYFKNRTRETLSRNVSGADLGEWFKMESGLRAQRSRNALFRTVGFLIGAGIGVLVGCAIISHPDFAVQADFNRFMLATFTVIALALVGGGICMIGSYFVQQIVEKKR